MKNKELMRWYKRRYLEHFGRRYPGDGRDLKAISDYFKANEEEDWQEYLETCLPQYWGADWPSPRWTLFWFLEQLSRWVPREEKKVQELRIICHHCGKVHDPYAKCS